MTELVRDLDPRYVLIKFDRDRRRIAPGRAVTGLCPQTDRRTEGQSDSSIHPPPPLPFQLRWARVYFLRYWPFVRGIHRSPANSPHKGQRRGVLMFSFICAWINGWVDNSEAGDLRRHHAHYDVIVMGYHVIHSGKFNCVSLISDIASCIFRP